MADRLSTKILLVVGESFYPDNTPRANRWNYFCRALDHNGWRTRVISRHFDGDLLGMALSCPIPVQRAPSLIRRVCRRVFSRLVFEYQIFWAMRRLSSFARKIDSYKEIDVVVAYGLPFSGIVLGAMLARLLGRPLVVEYGDPIDMNPALRPSLLERIANKWVMRRANRVIVTNENYAEYATQVYGRQVGYLAPVASLPAPSEDERQICEHIAHLSNGLKVFYAGMFYEGIRSGAPFVEALERMKGDLMFVHAGTRYRKAGECSRYRNIGYIDQRLVPYYLYWADVVLYFSNDSAFQTPSKIIEIAHLAQVILAIGKSFSEFEKSLLSQTQAVYVANDPSEIEAALGKIPHILKTERKNSADFQARIRRLTEYNANVFTKLEYVLTDCVL